MLSCFKSVPIGLEELFQVLCPNLFKATFLSGTCKRRVYRETKYCLNTACEQNGQENANLQTSLELTISLSDYTSGMHGFILARDVSTQTLGINVHIGFVCY